MVSPMTQLADLTPLFLLVLPIHYHLEREAQHAIYRRKRQENAGVRLLFIQERRVQRLSVQHGDC
jgi:hypothetical protein